MGSKGQKIGYIRVSSAEQNTARQIEAVGEVDELFEDRVSGKSRTERTGLKAAMKYARKGDTFTVASMDRAARSLPDLIDIVRELVGKGVEVEFLKERLTFRPDADDPYSNFQLHVLGAVAELERSLIAERRDAGIALAKRAGVYKGRKPALDAAKIEQARQLIAGGMGKAEAARQLGVGRSSLYRALNSEGTYAEQSAA